MLFSTRVGAAQKTSYFLRSAFSSWINNSRTVLHQLIMSQHTAHPTTDDVIIRVMTEADKPQISDFFKANFFADEPLTLGLGLEKPVDHDMTYMLSKVAQGTCLMALMQEKIVGALIAFPESSDEMEDLFDIVKNDDNSAHGKIAKILAQIELEANVFEKFQVDEVLHCEAMCTASDKRGYSLGTRLLKELIQLGIQKGLQLLTLDCTGVYSQRICEKMGMECLSTIYYRDYLNDKGEQVFHPPAPHNCIKSYALRLETKKEE